MERIEDGSCPSISRSIVPRGDLAFQLANQLAEGSTDLEGAFSSFSGDTYRVPEMHGT